MQARLGAKVRTADGRAAGSIQHLILDPATGGVRAVVVEQGFLFTHDVEIPVERLRAGDGDEVILAATEEEVKAMPAFDPSGYSNMPEQFLDQLSYPNHTNIFWPNTTPFPNTREGLAVYPYANLPTALPENETVHAGAESPVPAVERAQEDSGISRTEGALVEKGSSVLTSDGHHAGELREIEFDAETGRPTRIVVHRGFLLTEDTEFPGEVIASAHRGEVRLNITREKLESGRSQSSVKMV